jgi:two-component system sensor kinase FixL
MKTSVNEQAKGASPSPGLENPRMTVSALLFWLVLSCLLPLGFGISFHSYVDYQEGMTALEKDTARAVVAKVKEVESQLKQVELLANTLSTGGFLAQRDLAGFHQRSVLLLAKEEQEMAVVVFDKTGKQLLHSQIPWGQPLPKSLDFEPIRGVFNFGDVDKPVLIISALDQAPMIRMLVPVFSGRQVTYALGVSFSPEKFNGILRDDDFSEGATTTIIDNTGTIAAISREPEKFVGKKVAPDMWAQLQKKPEATFDIDLKNGAMLHAFYSSSSSTGWSVLMTMPPKSMPATLADSLFKIFTRSALIIAMSLGVAWLVRRRIVNSLKSLKLAAIAYSEGDVTAQPEDPLHETNSIAQALKLSALQLMTRTKELIDSNKESLDRKNELKEAQEIAQIGNWTWDFDSNEFIASEELSRQFGPDLLRSFQAKDGRIFPPAAQQQLDDANKEAVRFGAGYSLELNIFNKQGVLVWRNARGEAVFNEAGEVTGMRGTMQDITRYKTAEISLIENKMRLQIALSISALAVLDFDLQSGNMFFDEHWAAIQGYKMNEAPFNKIPFRSDSYVQNIFPEDIAVIQRNLEAHCRGDTSKFEATYRVRHKEGHCVWIQGIGKVVERDAAGNPLRVLGMARDITERKNNESMMNTLHNEMDAMLVWQVAQHTIEALAHEINQPLASASILCEATSRMMQDNEISIAGNGQMPNQPQELLKRIASEIERAGTVLRGLMQSLRKPDISRAPSMVNELVEESIQTALGEGVFGYQIIMDLADGLPLVKVNRLQVKKVLLNLIHNSAQAMQESQIVNGKIEITTALGEDGQAIFITVQDEGPGISTLMHQEIFQPFLSTKAHGLGVGLPISRTLIEAHGGKLWASQTTDAGATFHFTLPTVD